VSTYAEERVSQQDAEDQMMVEAIILVLCRQGNLRVQSRLLIGWSSLRAAFHVVELWKVPAELHRFGQGLSDSSPASALPVRTKMDSRMYILKATPMNSFP
jgi:hypothetical protein